MTEEGKNDMMEEGKVDMVDMVEDKNDYDEMHENFRTLYPVTPDLQEVSLVKRTNTVFCNQRQLSLNM